MCVVIFIVIPRCSLEHHIQLFKGILVNERSGQLGQLSKILKFFKRGRDIALVEHF